MSDPTTVMSVLALMIGLIMGICYGTWGEARRWRTKGDHDYMNRMESGGHLYQVKREPPQRRAAP